MASFWTHSNHPPCSYSLHTCPPSYPPQRHQTWNHFEWCANEHTWPTSITITLAHAFSTPTRVTESGCTPHVAFVGIVPVPSVLPHISHVPLSQRSKLPCCEMASCWTLSKHPPCSHILHTCQPSYSPHRHLNPTHIQWSGDEHNWPLQVQLCWHMHSTPLLACCTYLPSLA